MTRCTGCARDELPLAPAFPRSARVACAHVDKKGAPCRESPSPSVYDLEALTTIVAEDKLWDLGPDVAKTQPVSPPPGKVAEHLPYAVPIDGSPAAMIYPPDNKTAREILSAKQTKAKKPARRAAKKAPTAPTEPDGEADEEADLWEP